MALVFVLLALSAFEASVMGHTYHLGACPVVEPVQDFEMNLILGRWYVIQKTSTGSRCITYNFTATNEPLEYNIEQISINPILGLARVDNKYHYTGRVRITSPETPGKMTVRFPLSVAGSASYIVFSTDYNTYTGIFSCQKLAFANRHSATILSRRKTLDKIYLDKIRTKLSSFGVDPFDLSVIDQTNCPNDDSGIKINIDDETFSPQSIAGVVRKAGDKLGDGVEYAAEGAKKIYNTFSDSDKKSKREEIIENHDQDNAAAEWLP